MLQVPFTTADDRCWITLTLIRLIALKTIILKSATFLYLGEVFSDGLMSLLELVACILTFAITFFGRPFFSACLALAFLSWLVFKTFPLTLNHIFFEWLIAVMLVLRSSESVSSRSVDLRTLLVFSYSGVLVWSGLQKLYWGDYLDGQFFITEYFTTDTAMTSFIEFLVNGLGPIGLGDNALPIVCSMLGICVVVSEISLGTLLLNRNLQFVGLLALFMQLLIGFVSQEHTFAVTAVFLAALCTSWSRRTILISSYGWAVVSLTLAIVEGMR